MVLGLLVALWWLLLWSMGSGAARLPGLQSTESAAVAWGSAAPQHVGSVHVLRGALEARMLKWFAIPFSSGPHFDRMPHCDLSNLGDPTRQWLSFIELDKAVIQVYAPTANAEKLKLNGSMMT